MSHLVDLQPVLASLDAVQRAAFLHLCLCGDCAEEIPARILGGHLPPSMTPMDMADAYAFRSAGILAWSRGDADAALLELVASAELFTELGGTIAYYFPGLFPGLFVRIPDLDRKEEARDAQSEADQVEAAGEASTTRAVLGIVLRESGRPALAIEALRTALLPLEDGDLPMAEVPAVHVFAALCLAIAHLDLGAEDSARRAADNAKLIYGRVSDPLDVLRIHWLEARLFARADPTHGRNELRLVRDRLVTNGLFGEALLATIDLASPVGLTYGPPALARLADSLEILLDAPGFGTGPGPAHTADELRRISRLPGEQVQAALEALAQRFNPDLRFDLSRLVDSDEAPGAPEPLDPPDGRPAANLLARLEQRRPGLVQRLREEASRDRSPR